MSLTHPLILKLRGPDNPELVPSERAAVDLCCDKVAWSFGESGIVLRGGLNAQGGAPSLPYLQSLQRATILEMIAKAFPLPAITYLPVTADLYVPR